MASRSDRVPRRIDSALPSHGVAAEPGGENGGGSLLISVRPEGDHVVIALVGEIDISATRRLRYTVRELVRLGLVRIVVDLGGVVFVDAAGIGALIDATSDVARAGGKLEVTHHPRLMMLLEITRETDRVNVGHDRTHVAAVAG